MRLLPKREIDQAKAKERKQEIDTGLTLAHKVDELREARVTEEENFKKWRENTFAKIQEEINGYLEVKENLRIQTEKAEAYRKELIKPLDEEWLKVNSAKAEIQKNQALIQKSKESLKEQSQKLKEDTAKVSDIISRVKRLEAKAEKSKEEATSLKEIAQKEYEIARLERDQQAEAHEKAMTEIGQWEEQYQAGIKTNVILEKNLKEKEEEIIIREKDLVRQTEKVRTAWEEIKWNQQSKEEVQAPI